MQTDDVVDMGYFVSHNRVAPQAGRPDGNRRRQLKQDDPSVEIIEHRQAKYLNNRIEADQAIAELKKEGLLPKETQRRM